MEGGELMGKTSCEVKDRYNKKAYDNVTLRLPKGQKEIWKAKAEEKGFSLNSFIAECVREKLE